MTILPRAEVPGDLDMLRHHCIMYSRWLRPVGKLACMMEGITSSVCRQTVQALDDTCNMKGSLGEALRASLTLAIMQLVNTSMFF